MKCSHCGYSISPNDTFCTNCGASIDKKFPLIPLKKSPKIILITLIGFCLVIGVISFVTVSQGKSKTNQLYQDALGMIQSGNYEKAIEILIDLDDYQDAPQQLIEAEYLYANQLYESGLYTRAKEIYNQIGEYKDSQDLVLACDYNHGLSLLEQGSFDDAYQIFQQLGEYNDSENLLSHILFKQGEELFDSGNYQEARNYYIQVTGDDQYIAQDRIDSIDCINIAEEVTQWLTDEYYIDKDYLWGIMGLFGADFSFETEYDVKEYTYYFKIYYSDFFTSAHSVALAFGGTDEWTSSGQEQDIYEYFYNKGAKDITCIVENRSSSGELWSSFSYTYSDYLQNIETEAETERLLQEERAEKEQIAADFIATINNNNDFQDTVHEYLEENYLRRNNYQLKSSIVEYMHQNNIGLDAHTENLQIDYDSVQYGEFYVETDDEEISYYAPDLNEGYLIIHIPCRVIMDGTWPIEDEHYIVDCDLVINAYPIKREFGNTAPFWDIGSVNHWSRAVSAEMYYD